MGFLHNAVRFAKELWGFLGFCFTLAPGAVAAAVLIVVIYGTSPKVAQEIGFPTYEGDKAAAQIREHAELLAATCKAPGVHDGGVPMPPEGLPEWTPVHVEQRFESGLTVVSSLGPHENFQYIVRDLSLPEGSIFRIFKGKIFATK